MLLVTIKLAEFSFDSLVLLYEQKFAETCPDLNWATALV